jgi:hypothetical protein
MYQEKRFVRRGGKGGKRKRFGNNGRMGRVKLDVDERFGGRQKRSSTRRYEEDRDGHYVERGNLSMKVVEEGPGTKKEKMDGEKNSIE